MTASGLLAVFVGLAAAAGSAFWARDAQHDRRRLDSGRAVSPLGAQPAAVPIGRGVAFRPEARSAPARFGQRQCSTRRSDRVGVHLELFAEGRVVVVPAGIGVRGARRDGAYVTAGHCSYAVRTVEPTGVVELRRGSRSTLGELFGLWGVELSRRSFAGFRGPVRAWVDGRPVRRDPRSVPLRAHDEIVLAIGRRVPVHNRFVFRQGL